MAGEFYNPALGLFGSAQPAVTTTITTIGDREQRLLTGMNRPQLELVANLATEVEKARVEKRASMAKGIEALETVGAAGGCGFLRGYAPEFMPAGFNPSLLIGLGAHGGAMWAAHEGTEKKNAEMLSYEVHLEHVGNGALGAYAFEEMAEVGRKLKAAKLAKAAAGPAPAKA